VLSFACSEEFASRRVGCGCLLCAGSDGVTLLLSLQCLLTTFSQCRFMRLQTLEQLGMFLATLRKRTLLLLDCRFERSLLSRERVLLLLELAKLSLILTAFMSSRLQVTLMDRDLFFKDVTFGLEMLHPLSKSSEFLFKCSRFVVKRLLLPGKVGEPNCCGLCLCLGELMIVLELPHPFDLHLGGLCCAGSCVLSILYCRLGGLLSGDCLGQLVLGGGKCPFAIHKASSLLAECLLRFAPAPGIELFKAIMEGEACCSGLFCCLRCLGKRRQVRFKLAQEVIEPSCVRFSVCEVA
jgi:hypothetical protein